MHQWIKFILFWNYTIYVSDIATTCFRYCYHVFQILLPHVSDTATKCFRYCCLLASKQTAVSVWHMHVAVCTVLNSWWWAEWPSETCRGSFQIQISLIHWCIFLVFYRTNITVHGPMNAIFDNVHNNLYPDPLKSQVNWIFVSYPA